MTTNITNLIDTLIVVGNDVNPNESEQREIKAITSADLQVAEANQETQE